METVGISLWNQMLNFFGILRFLTDSSINEYILIIVFV